MNRLIDSVRSGDRRALSRAATLVENGSRDIRQILAEMFRSTGRARTIGITGAPGAGKSTLADRIIRHLRAAGRTVAVVAVDPTSPYSGGAILGDRIRMQDHHADPGVFIRSMATRGNLGGLAPSTADLCVLLDAAGFDVILIETVGVGQDEVDVARVADVTAVVLAPGMGDEVQALKAGIMEIADLYILNKADHLGIERLEREVRSLLDLSASAVKPAIVRTVASDGTGVAEAVAAMEAFNRDQDRMQENWEARLRTMLRDRLLERLPAKALSAAAAEIGARRRDPYSAADELIREILRSDQR